nr:zygote arrest protein 1-like [Pseudochaenichthys georgianus]
MRFLRPVSIYSPVFDRRISRKKLSYEGEGEGEADESVDHVESGHECEKGDSGEEDTRKDFKTTFHRSTKGSSFQFLEQRVEPILCKDCSQTTCNCEKKLRHINMKRPHRQDLCCR